MLLAFLLLAGTALATGHSLRHGQEAAPLGSPPTVLTTGLCITLIALVLTVAVARRNRYALQAVDAATAELRASQRGRRALVENSAGVMTRLDSDLRFL